MDGWLTDFARLGGRQKQDKEKEDRCRSCLRGREDSTGDDSVRAERNSSLQEWAAGEVFSHLHDFAERTVRADRDGDFARRISALGGGDSWPGYLFERTYC